MNDLAKFITRPNQMILQTHLTQSFLQPKLQLHLHFSFQGHFIPIGKPQQWTLRNSLVLLHFACFPCNLQICFLGLGNLACLGHFLDAFPCFLVVLALLLAWITFLTLSAFPLRLLGGLGNLACVGHLFDALRLRLFMSKLCRFFDDHRLFCTQQGRSY